MNGSAAVAGARRAGARRAGARRGVRLTARFVDRRAGRAARRRAAFRDFFGLALDFLARAFLRFFAIGRLLQNVRVF